MPRVTIGVPVYNSAAHLEQCLDNIAAQTFCDFKVIILDNASTDSTAVIAKAFVERDPRFFYKCQSHNKGARQNFADVLALAETPYFMWRAHDDLSDVNFVEQTVALLDRNPSVTMAVGKVVSQKSSKHKHWDFPKRAKLEPEFVYTLRLLFQSHPSWIYAMFRHSELSESFTRVCNKFPHLIASDHLTLFPFLISRRVTGSNTTTFMQRFNRPVTPVKRHPLRKPQEMMRLRNDFLVYCRTEISSLISSSMMKLLLIPAASIYAGRAYRWPKILGAYFRVALGEKPNIDTSVGTYDDPTSPSAASARIDS